mgnify:CR=1 FL=1
MMNKDIQYYMSLSYKTEIEPFPVEEGGGYEAYHPTLGRSTCVAVGDTQEEALQNLKETKQSLFEFWLEKGLPIPLPENENSYDQDFSGKILVRTTPDMHRQLFLKAKEQGVSLNAYINQAIALGFSLHSFDANLQQKPASKKEDEKSSTSKKKKVAV